MDFWHVQGGKRLSGSCEVQGSKNASLPILAASIARPLRAELTNVPRLRDVNAALRILRSYIGKRHCILSLLRSTCRRSRDAVQRSCEKVSFLRASRSCRFRSLPLLPLQFCGFIKIVGDPRKARRRRPWLIRK